MKALDPPGNSNVVTLSSWRTQYFLSAKPHKLLLEFYNNILDAK